MCEQLICGDLPSRFQRDKATQKLCPKEGSNLNWVEVVRFYLSSIDVWIPKFTPGNRKRTYKNLVGWMKWLRSTQF